MKCSWSLKINRSRPKLIKLLLLMMLGAGVGQSAVVSDETFETLPVGTNLFSKVSVLNKTRTDLFIRHSKGTTNIKVKDLDQVTQLKLGYQVEQPRPTKMEQVLEATSINQLESNPRVQELEAMVAGQAAEALERLDEQTAYAVAGGLVLLYLLFSFFCRLICIKTGNPPSPLIWIPFFKQIPLLKAAGMSGWWILANFVPPLLLVVYIIWSFKIVHSRAKHVIFGVMLLLPVINVLAFFYLALSGDGTVKASKRNVINLHNPPRPEAAIVANSLHS